MEVVNDILIIVVVEFANTTSSNVFAGGLSCSRKAITIPFTNLSTKLCKIQLKHQLGEYLINWLGELDKQDKKMMISLPWLQRQRHQWLCYHRSSHLSRPTLTRAKLCHLYLREQTLKAKGNWRIENKK